MAWWNVKTVGPNDQGSGDIDGVILVDEHVLLIRKPALKPATRAS